MSPEHTINGVSVPSRVRAWEEQFDKTLQLGAHLLTSLLTSDVQVSRGSVMDLSDLRSSTSDDSRGSQLSPSRQLRKVTGRIDINATASQGLGHNSPKQRQSPSFEQDRHASPSAVDNTQGGAKNATALKRWFTRSRKKRPDKCDGMRDDSTSDSPKSSTDLSVISGEDRLDTKRTRFGWPKRGRHDRPRNKLRKTPSPTNVAPDGVKQEVRRGSKNVRKRFGLRRVRFKQSNQSLKAAARRGSQNAAQQDLRSISHRASSGSLRKVVLDEAVVFNLSEDHEPRARALRQKWLDSRRARPARLDGGTANIDQETVVTDRSDATQSVEDAQPSVTAVEKVQLGAATQRAEVKTERTSRFYEHLSDSDDGDHDTRDYSSLGGPYASRITEAVSRFLAPTNYRQELTVVNPDEPLGEEAQQRRDEVDDLVRRLRNDVGGNPTGSVNDPQTAHALRTSRAKSGRCHLRRTRTVRRPRHVMSPIPEADSPVSTEYSVVFPEEPIGEGPQQRRDEVDDDVRQSSGSFNQDTTNSQNTYRSQTVRENSGRCTLRRTRTFRRPRRPLSPVPKADSPVPIPDSSVAEQTSPAAEEDHPSPDIASKDSDSTSSSDYVSCRSSTSSANAERCHSAEEAIIDIGIARTQSFTKVLEPKSKSVNILRSKGKEREERVDTPMTTPNDPPAIPDFQKDHVPWWEQAPAEPKVPPPKFACGPSVMVMARENEPEKEAKRSRAPTPEAGALLRSITTPARPSPPKKNSRGKHQSIGRHGIAADLENKSQYHGNYVATSRRRAKSMSEEAVGVHLPVQEPVEIPRDELRRIMGGCGMSGL